ncbi:rCG55596 [Rattus norvegicus]|uniref:RCG55596 n=1 Tax=Rattus norvegicus TaxID=10116 RepID=A6JR57_RAT|nr:rCG55596 [Rattus norvegicus]
MSTHVKTATAFEKTRGTLQMPSLFAELELQRSRMLFNLFFYFYSSAVLK